MKISDLVAQFIREALDQEDGVAVLNRNELAGMFHCVPSQINYVITSRFTPELGYVVESQRGGGGYIRIKRVECGKNTFIMHVINSIGEYIDQHSASIILQNLASNDVLSTEDFGLISAAVSSRSLAVVPIQLKDQVRAAVLKNMLLAVYQRSDY